MRRALLILALPVLLLAACGNDDEGVTTDPGTTDGTADDGGTTGGDAEGAVGDPGGAEGGLVVSIEPIGGFTTPSRMFAQLPTAVVYEDGTTASQAAVLAIYPGPAVMPLAAGEVDEATLERIVALADEAGLLADDVDPGPTMVADAPTTVITVVVDGVTYETSVDALEVDGTVEPEGLTEEQAATRERIRQFVAEVTDLVVAAETGEMLEPDRYRVMALPPTEASPDDGIEPNTVEWPLPDVELVQGECVAVTGDDADALSDALDDATEITRWVTPDGEEWGLAVRMVLPHEPDC